MQYKYTKLTQDKWRINTKQKRTISLCRLDIKQEVPLHRGKHESSNLNFFKPKHWEYVPHTIAPGIKRSRKGLPPCSQSFFSKWQLFYLCVKPPHTGKQHWSSFLNPPTHNCRNDILHGCLGMGNAPYLAIYIQW